MPVSHGFTRVDAADDPERWVACLHTLHAEPFYRAYKRRVRELLAARETDRHLEVGAGIGVDARALAGAVIGLDRSLTMCRETKRAGLACAVAADAEALPFPAASFDGAWADRTFQHLTSPAAALTELVRVLRPGGRLVVVDPDYGTQTMSLPPRHAAHRPLVDRVLAFRADHALRNGTLAHRLAQRFEQARLRDVGLESRTLHVTDPSAVDNVMGLRSWARAAAQAGRMTEEEATSWETMYDDIVAQGELAWSVAFFLTYGRKPGAALP